MAVTLVKIYLTITIIFNLTIFLAKNSFSPQYLLMILENLLLQPKICISPNNQSIHKSLILGYNYHHITFNFITFIF